MPLPDGFTDIPPGKIAAIATVLEMRRPSVVVAPDPIPADGWTLSRVIDPDLDSYVDLLRRVGGRHLWYQRLMLPPEEIAAKIKAATTLLHVLTVDGRAEGIAELDLSEEGVGELVYFGVTDQLIGTRAARFMMNAVLHAVFSRPIEAPTDQPPGRPIDRLWLHTNTIDHPKAMAFYRRSGFTPVRQMLELADDPRLSGLFPADAAPQVPFFRR